MKLAWDVLGQIAVTMWHLLPWLAGLGLVFAALSWIMPCNEGQSWWRKKGLVTDLSYWVMAALFTRSLRIWVTVTATMWIFHITDGAAIANFYLHGHGLFTTMPLWAQVIVYLLVTDFALYWIHRLFHDGFLWKYHAVHHATKDLEWISAARFHPLNLALGTAAVDVAALLWGISPDVFIFMGPFNIITSCLVHANLNWDFGILRGVFVSPVFHRWHHSSDVRDKNFASTFAVWDVMFGTYHMPVGALPGNYGIDDVHMPEGMMAQILYPLLQPDPAADQDAGAQPAAAR